MPVDPMVDSFLNYYFEQFDSWCGVRAEILPVGPDVATRFKRTTPAVRRCKNEQRRRSYGRETGRRAKVPALRGRRVHDVHVLLALLRRPRLPEVRDAVLPGQNPPDEAERDLPQFLPLQRLPLCDLLVPGGDVCDRRVRGLREVHRDPSGKHDVVFGLPALL